MERGGGGRGGVVTTYGHGGNRSQFTEHSEAPEEESNIQVVEITLLVAD